MKRYEIINATTKEVLHTANTLNECRRWARENNNHSPDFYARRTKKVNPPEDRACRDMRVEFKDLLDAAFILYGLKVNSTNKLYVSFHLTRFYKKEGLITPNGRIIAPVSIYDEIKAINDKYRSTTPPSLR